MVPSRGDQVERAAFGWGSATEQTVDEDCLSHLAAAWADPVVLPVLPNSVGPLGQSEERGMTYRFDFAALLPYWRVLLAGCWLTLWMTVISVILGFAIGLITVMANRSRFRLPRLLASGYIEIIRNTPFLVQVLFIYFGLPSLGPSLTPWPAAILALSLNCGAFAAEIIRGGIDGIPKGQFEAGTALGLGPFQVMRFVKPALRTIFPALSGQFILLLLATSIVSSISAEELTAVAQEIDTTTFRSFEVYIVATLLYLAISLLFSFVFKAIERIAFSYPVK
jgi:polar amino acid transport system permease protein